MFAELKDRLVLVTGGTRGIGRSIVEHLARTGCKVVFTYQNSHGDAEDIVATLNAQGSQCWAYQADVTDPESSQGLAEKIEKNHGSIYGLVNNAGITADKSFLTMPLQQWNQVIDTNLNGAAYLSQAVMIKMLPRKQGKVVMMSSVSGLQASPGQANYSASKAALIGLTRTLSHEAARYNIQVNAVAPGFIETEMVASLSEKTRSQIPKLVPARRMGKVDDVAKPVLFLLSDSANYITGHTLVIDGGLSV